MTASVESEKYRQVADGEELKNVAHITGFRRCVRVIVGNRGSN
jgi:hypothetical protein